ncbi:4154_t:CDS:2 [Entrophospora sp. SA101]|nr:2603_t:CDS:2 [Entrophospora sp. SA101]CAJ0847263.1 4154_t:CDS:2 [Entrophospora sp. SA101]CAJ0871481.1 53_t:CDS:2 [Entrophospora sp. SA101]
MSDTPILSIEVVKKWKRANVVDFLKEKKEELELENEDIQIIDNNRVNGCAFLELNVDKLMQDGLKRGPAENITQLIKDIKGGKSRTEYTIETCLVTSTRKYRPDLSYLVFDACLARGEEKGPETNDDPAMELILKLTWTYGNCPYIFGYYAIATRVTYCYLYLEGNSIERKDLLTCLLDKVEGRIQAFNIGRNIGRLLHLLRQTVPEYFQREFVVLHRTSGKVIEFMQNTVVKRYPSVDSVMNLKTLYDEMAKHQVPFIDSLNHVNMEEGSTPFMIFLPKGMMCKPRSKEQLIKALCCVLTALKALHKMKIMHRDLRWDNMLKSIDRDSWFIIDFDDACHVPSNIPNTQLAKESHAPEIFEFHHNESVDIWSVGYLIRTASVELQELDELKVYARMNLMAKDKINRPTAKDALRWLWSKYRDVLKDFLEEEEMEES